MEKKPCVLAIDDQNNILALLRKILESEGYAVSLAGDGESGIALLEEIKPDIILLDIRMPGLDGYQTLERIRRISSVPVLMLTGVHEDTALARCFDIGANDYVVKPFVNAVLLARIKSKLKRSRGQVQKGI